jgi:hypothetical protein
MRESSEQLLRDFLDCIEALRSPHIGNPEFQMKWMTKLRDTTKALEDLGVSDEAEFRLVMDRYKEEFKEKFGEHLSNEDPSIIRSTYRVQDEL